MFGLFSRSPDWYFLTIIYTVFTSSLKFILEPRNPWSSLAPVRTYCVPFCLFVFAKYFGDFVNFGGDNLVPWLHSFVLDWLCSSLISTY